MAAALAVVSAVMKEQNDLGGRWDSQDSRFKAIRGQVDEALALPEDVAVTLEPIVVTQEQDDQILTLVRSLHDKMDGMEDVLATLALHDEAPAEPTTAG